VTKHSATIALPFAQSPTKPIFDAPLARRADPATSHAAAAQVRLKVGGQCERILELIRLHPDHTAGELAAKADADLDFYVICRRVSILEREGLIEIDSTGRLCAVRKNLARTYRVKESTNV
jgi:hypothetical protein